MCFCKFFRVFLVSWWGIRFGLFKLFGWLFGNIFVLEDDGWLFEGDRLVLVLKSELLVLLGVLGKVIVGEVCVLSWFM